MRGLDTWLQCAVGILDRLGATGKVLAGGSDLVGGVMKDWVQGKGMPIPTGLVDVTTIPDMHGIRASGNGLTIGAATTLTEIVDSPEIRQTLPILSQAALSAC